MKATVLLNLILFCFCAYAQERESFELNRGLFTMGTLTEFPGAYQVDTQGTKSGNFDFNPYFAFGLEFTLPKPWFWMTEIGITLPKTTPDEALTIYTMFLRTDFAYLTLYDKLKLLIGTSLMVTVMKGNGGTTTLGNAGTSTTFYRPELTQTAVNNTLDLGLEYQFSKHWSTRLQAIAYQIFNAEKTQYSYTLGVNYYWGYK